MPSDNSRTQFDSLPQGTSREAVCYWMQGQAKKAGYGDRKYLRHADRLQRLTDRCVGLTGVDRVEWVKHQFEREVKEERAVGFVASWFVLLIFGAFISWWVHRALDLFFMHPRFAPTGERPAGMEEPFG